MYVNKFILLCQCVTAMTINDYDLLFVKEMQVCPPNYQRQLQKVSDMKDKQYKCI